MQSLNQSRLAAFVTLQAEPITRTQREDFITNLTLALPICLYPQQSTADDGNPLVRSNKTNRTSFLSSFDCLVLCTNIMITI